MTTDQPPMRRRRKPPLAGRHLTLVDELLHRWDDREHPMERFEDRDQEERVKRARAASLLHPAAVGDPEPECADCPQKASA